VHGYIEGWNYVTGRPDTLRGLARLATIVDSIRRSTGALPILVAVLALASALFKFTYWRHIDAVPRASSPESATELGRFGAVRSVEAPHTEENYLTREMGFALARKHARRLRQICLMLIGALPPLLALLACLSQTHVIHTLCASLAVLCVTLGLFVERCLFFAEAKHVVMLYYGDAQPNRA